MSEVRWHKLRREDIAEAATDGAVLLLPIGAIEQHGPHLPLDTDTNAATTVAVGAARLLDETRDPRALVLPEIHWGLSPYWLGFPGTLTVRPETLLSLFRDLAASVAHHGFERMVIVNGHGGNAGIIAVAATVMADAGVRAAALSYWDLIATEMADWSHHDGGSIGHAGEAETSIARFLQPDAIGPMPHADACAPLQDLFAKPEMGVGYRPPDPGNESPSGVYGFAPGATAALGERIITAATERLAAFVRAFATPGEPIARTPERPR
ncbi:MAG TPA: creatininase family protein [Thermomicrobiales bacterium]|nr:creatininase family protein [Thermomicrobiales bacterium]